MENKNVKKRIERDKPNKKWTEDEVIKIINYLREAPEMFSIFFNKQLQ